MRIICQQSPWVCTCAQRCPVITTSRPENVKNRFTIHMPPHTQLYPAAFPKRNILAWHVDDL